jgi:hypothetical protein
MNHFAAPDFWYCYRHLPWEVQELVYKNFGLLRQDPQNPAVRLKKVGEFWSARVGLNYRVLARERAEGLVWFWIGTQSQYGQLAHKIDGIIEELDVPKR